VELLLIPGVEQPADPLPFTIAFFGLDYPLDRDLVTELQQRIGARLLNDP
jgi:hypothetical protein